MDDKYLGRSFPMLLQVLVDAFFQVKCCQGHLPQTDNSLQLHSLKEASKAAGAVYKMARDMEASNRDKYQSLMEKETNPVLTDAPKMPS